MKDLSQHKPVLNYSRIGENIKRIRLSKGLTRDDLERLTGMTTIYQKETGRRNILERDLVKIAKALKCPISDLTGDTELYKEFANGVVAVNKYLLSTLQLDNLDNPDTISDTVPFAVSYLHDSLKVKRAIIIKCDNNYMSPAIEINNELFVDLEQRDFMSDGIFLLKDIHSERAIIKRAYKPKSTSNTVFLTYDNHTAGTHPMEFTDEEFANIVYGRAVYCGKTLWPTS